jgi:hypothetical protein
MKPTSAMKVRKFRGRAWTWIGETDWARSCWDRCVFLSLFTPNHQRALNRGKAQIGAGSP